MLLPSEGASFCKPCFSSCGLTEDRGAANTQNYRLCMAKDGGDFIASWAFHVHEVGVGALHQALLLVFPLLLFWRGMKEILSELGEAETQRFRHQRRKRGDGQQPRLPHTGASSPLAAPGVCAAGPPSYLLSAPVSAGPRGPCSPRPRKCGGQTGALCDPHPA